MTKKLDSIEKELAKLDRAYRSAIYQVYTKEKTIQLSIAQPNQILDLLLSQENRFTWAFVTAHNPHSQCLSVAENHQRHQSLIRFLATQDVIIFDGVGKDKDGFWTPETSILILGINLEDAISLGRKFQQNAIVYGELGKISQLLWIEY